VRPPEQPLELLLEQQIGECDVIFDGFLRHRAVARPKTRFHAPYQIRRG
jgi:hypothetical protein